MLQGISLLHLDDEEVVAILLELFSRGILVKEDVVEFLKAPEKPRWVRVAPV